MTALCLVGLCAFAAMAIDLGILAAARTQCQNCADSASLGSTRSLDNKPTSTNSNRPNAESSLDTIVGQNNLLSGNFSTGNITSKRYGVYDYNAAVTPPRFEVSYPSTVPVGRSWTATEVEVSGTFNTFFGRISGLDSAGKVTGVNTLTTAARAVAVYRPRDMAMVLDMSGSMKFGCVVSANGVYLSNDPVIPKMSHYQRYNDYITTNPNAGATGGSAAGRQNPLFTIKQYVRTDTAEVYAPSNVTVENAGGPPAVKDFYYTPSNLNSPGTAALTPAPNMSAVAPATPLPRAFHHWDPSVANANDPDNYLPATFDYGSWSSNYNAANFILYPTPDAFGDQSAANLIGDRLPRKSGAERKTTPGTWDPTAADGAAINVAEYLGWINKYTGGTPPGNNSLPTPAINNASAKVNNTTFVRTAGGPTAGTTAATTYAVNWNQFRDATWERYGYDLDVNAYVANRPADWDPGIDPETPAPINPTDARGYAAGDARRAWWATNKSTLVNEGRYKGFVMGPGYWGKSFFMWPPDPRTPTDDTIPATASNYVPGDWRIRFLYNTSFTRLNVNVDNGTAGGIVENVSQVTLRNGNGDPTNTFAINYGAVLKWIKSPPMSLPPNLRAGRVRYYTSIPDDVDTSTGATQDKRFWRAYIDYVMKQTGMAAHETRGWPEGAGSTTHNIFQGELTGYDVDAAGLRPADPRPYTNYLDNPSRPRHHYWFGPHSMLAFLNSENSWAGTVHETQTWQLKAGVNSVLDDIRNNHPNDAVGLCYFSAGGYGFTSVGCSQDFELLKASLFYPNELVNNGKVWTEPTAEFDAFDTGMNWRGNNRVQNAQGGTDPQIGFAVAFNILAPSTASTPALPSIPGAGVQVNGRSVATQAVSGRRGRRGASKIIVFETDGVPNNTRSANFNAAGFNSFYAINTGSGSGGDPKGAAYAIIDQMRKNTSTTTGGDSGLSLASSKAKVYSIGFGDLFGLPGNTRNIDARAFLLEVQKRGGTSSAADTAIPSYQIITGAYQDRIDSLRVAFERILQSGVQVTLIE